MSDRVYLLGAGFSRAISQQMPLMQELSEAVRDDLKIRGAPEPPDPGGLSADAERWLSYLAEPAPWLGQAEVLRNRAGFIDVSESIATVIRDRQAQVVATPMPAWLESLARHWVDAYTTIITFNYDVLVETAILDAVLAGTGSERGKGANARVVGDLYRIAVTPIGNRIAGVLGSAGDLRTALLKLHGSVSWYWGGLDAMPNDPLFDVGLAGEWCAAGTEPLETERIDRLVADKVPAVVPPAASKSGSYGNDLLRSQWRLAAERLTEASELVLIGYSLPPSDLTVRTLLQTSFTEGTVIPVDPDPDGALEPNLKRLFGDRIDDRFLGHPDAVERFVASALPPARQEAAQ